MSKSSAGEPRSETTGGPPSRYWLIWEPASMIVVASAALAPTRLRAAGRVHCRHCRSRGRYGFQRTWAGTLAAQSLPGNELGTCKLRYGRGHQFCRLHVSIDCQRHGLRGLPMGWTCCCPAGSGWPRFSGFAGMLLDSVLGATLERPGRLGNNSVNFISSAFSAFVTILIAFLFR